MRRAAFLVVPSKTPNRDCSGFTGATDHENYIEAAARSDNPELAAAAVAFLMAR